MTTDPTGAEERADLPGEAGSIWLASSETTDYAALDGGLEVDTAVVGGGIAGITTAARLVDSGRDVALIEADRILNGVTGHTTAKLTSLHGLVYTQISSTFGEQKARRYGRANEAAIDYVEAQVDERDIDCDFERTAAYTYVDDPDRRAAVEKEVETARHLGLPASFTESTPLVSDVGGAVRFDDQAQFHPRKYLLAQAERIVDAGSHVFEHTRATGLDPGAPVEVETERGTVTADQAVVATHFPLYDHGLYFARMSPRRGYVLAVRVDGSAPEGLHYRSGDPYFSVRPHPTGDDSLALVGGQNHRTGHGDEFERYRKLEREARDHLDVASVEYRWSTQDYTSVDGVPFVGKLAPQTDDVYVATGFGGWGMSNGIAAGLLLSDRIRGVPNDWRSVYTPTRFKPGASARTLVDHNRHVVEHFTKDRLKSSPPSTPDLAPGEGRVVHEGTRAIGLYRDEDGATHAVSAVCPHMGCILHWNGADATWDCPCHGARFSHDGAVIDGPAMTDLEDLDLPD